MALTKFGEMVRGLRRQLGLTLAIMADDLRVTPAFLSAMETGRSKIPDGWVAKISDYYISQGLKADQASLKKAADLANESVSLSGLPLQHQLLVAGFANSELNQKQLRKFADLLAEVYGETPHDGQL